ncbi:MAG: AgmX/PglI C-terminal domain-containing protein [Myxococcota bacterium]
MTVPVSSGGKSLLVVLVLTFGAPASAQAQGLEGLGPPGQLKQDASPKIIQFEDSLHKHLNERYRDSKSALTADPKLRNFARRHARLAASGQVQSTELKDRIKKQRIAPHGYHFQFLAGPNEKAVINAVRRDQALTDALGGDFARIGVGAFLAPADKPFFQVMILLAKDIDPRAGKPGLTAAQTDAVMKGAVLDMEQRCYQNQLERDPNFGGQALFEFLIGAQGAVKEVKLLRSPGDDNFELCLLGIARKLKFPEPYKGVPVTLRHPVRFQPAQGKKILGKLSDGQVRATFARAAADFRACYRQRLEALGRKELAGQILLSLDVTPAGSVSAIDVVDNTTLDKRLEACVVQRVKTLRFPEPKYGGPVNITFPLEFGS